MTPEASEAEALERAAEWRLRLVDADPTDRVSARAAVLLQRLAADLSSNDYTSIRTELRSIGNWLAESDLISDYKDLAFEYRARIGASDHPADGADYLRGLLEIAQSLV
jgi:hypothetical protein